MNRYAISVSEMSPDGTTLCRTWVVEADLALAIIATLETSGAPTNSTLFSADAIGEAAFTLPIIFGDIQ